MTINPKSAYWAIGYSYPSSKIARDMKRADEGCWFYYTMDQRFNALDDEVGPYETANAAVHAGEKAVGLLPIAPGHETWMLEQMARDASGKRFVNAR